MNGAWGIMAVSSEVDACRELVGILNRLSCDAICAQDIEQALGLLREHPIRLVFCDWTLRDGSYRDLLKGLRILKTKARMVVTSRQADWDAYLESMRLGAFDMITTPCRPADVEWMLIQANREERNQTRLSADIAR